MKFHFHVLKHYIQTKTKKNEVKFMTNNIKHNYFFCYNKHLHGFLKLKNIPYIVKARTLESNASGQIFTLYEQTPELSEAIKQYKEIKG